MTKREPTSTSASEFWSNFESFVVERGRGAKSLAGFIDSWDSLVQRLAEGYRFGWTEFSNDVRLRTFLEEILTRFAGSDELEPFLHRIESIDDRYRTLLIPGVVVRDSSLPWWERGVLVKAGGHEYADEVLRLFGIRVREA